MAEEQQPQKQEVPNPEPTFYGMTRSQIFRENKIVGILFILTVQKKELDLYEMIRKPRKVESESDEPLLPETIMKLKGIFECPICRCLMKSPVYIKPCMHKFCNECITKYLNKVYFLVFERYRKMQCPSCRAPIGTRRFITPDKEYEDLSIFFNSTCQNIVELLYPNKQAIENFENEELKQMIQNFKPPVMKACIESSGNESQNVHSENQEDSKQIGGKRSESEKPQSKDEDSKCENEKDLLIPRIFSNEYSFYR